MLGPPTAWGVIDFDATATSGNTVFTYSKENLVPSAGSLPGFYAVGDFDTGSDLLTRATLGKAWQLTLDGEIWLRYDVNEHLAFRGTAPLLFSANPDPDAPDQSTDLFPGGVLAWNADTFAEDGFLLFPYDPPSDLGRITEATNVEVDLKGVLATNGQGAGVVRVRAFRTGLDAVDGEGASGLDKSHVVARVANSVRVIPRPVRQRAKAISGFLQFGVGARVPVGGFELVIDADHRRPDGEPVGTALEDVNVDVGQSELSFFGAGGFAFAPAKDGWTVETVDERTGLCRGDAAAAAGDPNADPPQEPAPSLAVHPVDFGVDSHRYPVGPATTAPTLGRWHLCATVPTDNAELLQEGSYRLSAVLAPRRPRPFPPQGVEDALVGTVWRDGTTVHIPFLSLSAGYDQELIVFNRHRRLVDYVLVMHSDTDEAARPSVASGKLASSGPTRIRVEDIPRDAGVERASATLAIVSFPNMIEVTSTTANPVDGSTDTVVLHRGLSERYRTAPPSANERNRTTVHVPLLTTASGTNQRLTIVNRLFRDIRYTLTMRPADDVTPDPPVVRGVATARASTTLRVRDVVTLADGASAAATLELAAGPPYVDVSMTLVNQMDGATDTVVLHRGVHDR